MEPSRNVQGGFKFMILSSKINLTSPSWNMIPMPETVIDRVSLLGNYQPKILIFADHKGLLIGYGGVDLTGVDGDEGKMKMRSH